MLAKLINGQIKFAGGKTLKCKKTFTRSIPEVSYVDEEITDEYGGITTVRREVITYRDEEYVDDVIIVNPREEDWLEAGYKTVEDNRLEEKEGFYQVPEYTEEEDKIVATYHYEEITDEEETIA